MDNAALLRDAVGGPALGLRFTCISSKLTAGEVEYIVKDSGAKA
jgi:hypothetical protein